jgi:hypothetical protein
MFSQLHRLYNSELQDCYENVGRVRKEVVVTQFCDYFLAYVFEGRD